ncbi:MAG: 16S rRNA (cytosine(1402)-N(4))-methyltransferase RsmH [Alphaproteobacteria bacterium]|nr:16S rRNA (cytosine(1402)-N(4))-methyltransferase RsmH [Alphaproteobacteria bacterium]
MRRPGSPASEKPVRTEDDVAETARPGETGGETDGRRAPAGSPHVPVLCAAAIAALRPRGDGLYVDGTFGAGGYSKAMLESGAGRVFAFDRDPDAVAIGEALAARSGGRLVLIRGRFGAMEALLGERGVSAVDGVALDLGVSSMQLDRPERGFSFRADGPLDMRMAGSADGESSAARLVNELSERDLADLIWRVGEEPAARRIARAICAVRQSAPIDSTAALADVVRSAARAARAVGSKGRGREEERIDPATRTFQALRIAVNDELGEIDRGLAASERLLRPGGRLAVVSFHSLEDRRVKRFMAARAASAPLPSRHAPGALSDRRRPPSLVLVGRAVAPDAAELAANPRARSAKLRVAERTANAAWEDAA